MTAMSTKFGNALSSNAIVVSRPSALTDATALDAAKMLEARGVTSQVAFDPAFPVNRIAPAASRTLQPRVTNTMRSEAGFQVLPDHLEDLKVMMSTGTGAKKAVILYAIKTKSGAIAYVPPDGAHRVNACIDLGIPTIEAVILPATTNVKVVEGIAQAANNWLNGRRNDKADESYVIIDMHQKGNTNTQIAAALPGVSRTHVENVIARENARVRIQKAGIGNYAGVRNLSDETMRHLSTLTDQEVYKEAVKLAADAGMKTLEASVLAGAVRGMPREKALSEIDKRRESLAPVIQRAAGGKSAKALSRDGIAVMAKAAAAAQHAHTTITGKGILTMLPTPADQAQALQSAQDMERAAKKLVTALRAQMRGAGE